MTQKNIHVLLYIWIMKMKYRCSQVSMKVLLTSNKEISTTLLGYTGLSGCRTENTGGMCRMRKSIHTYRNRSHPLPHCCLHVHVFCVVVTMMFFLKICMRKILSITLGPTFQMFPGIFIMYLTFYLSTLLVLLDGQTEP